jgi:hypothetical protein
MAAGRRWCLAAIVGHPLPTHVIVTIAAAQTNGSRADDGAPASLAIPCPFLLVEAMEAKYMTGATTKVVAVRTKVPWHHWAFLAVTRNRNDCSGVSNNAR